jgi:glycosyltransferase involved in cell wall biosynthesis
MNGLDVFVLSSHSEPFGIVLLEAMASGCAIVATDAGGVPDIVRHEQEGILVPPREPEAMAEAILRLVKDGDMARTLSESARQRVRSEFPLWRHVARMREVYESLHGE